MKSQCQRCRSDGPLRRLTIGAFIGDADGTLDVIVPVAGGTASTEFRHRQVDLCDACRGVVARMAREFLSGLIPN